MNNFFTSSEFAAQLNTAILFLFLLPFAAGCSSSNDSKPEKMDSALQRKIELNEKENPKSPIQFIGKTTSDLSQRMKEELIASGIKIESIAGNIFTATGTAAEIKEISSFVFITSLELVQKMDLK